MHSHHSHSGQYVSHAVDTLEEVVAAAQSKGFVQFCLTEHMPRLNSKYLYPEEEEKEYTTETLKTIFDSYEQHARKLQKQYKDLTILVGFEVEGVDEEHIEYAASFKDKFDMTVGSVHHVFGVPLDFDKSTWLKAKNLTKSQTSRELFKEYFELQYKVISALSPSVIGHFDLIRLFMPLDEIDPTTGKYLKDIDIETDWPEVWHQLVLNIKRAIDSDSLFELNSAAIRKGWPTPYPQPDVAKAILKYGGKFCFSDDSHGIAQIALNYPKVLKYIQELGVQSVHYLDIDNGKTVVRGMPLEEFQNSEFWSQF